MPRQAITGIILAGGQSLRMGQEKSLLLLGGQPVLAHVISRFAPQVAGMALNANGDPARFAGFGLEIIADFQGLQGAGPLAGILAGLDHAARSGFGLIATVPCDAPFLPLDLVAQLSRAGTASQIRAACGESGPEPLFALWPVSLAGALRRFVDEGGRKVQDAIAALPHADEPVQFPPGHPDPFLNLNRPGDVALASASIAQDGITQG